MIELFARYGELLRGVHFAAERLHDFHPLVRTGCHPNLNRAALLIPIPIEEFGRRAEGRRPRWISAALKEERKILRKLQQFQLALGKEARVEARAYENRLGLVE